MGYNTAATEWPSTSPSPQIKALIDQFFLLLDSDSLDTGDRLAETIFMPDGTMVGPGGAAEGSEAIRRSRDEAWKLVKTRRHTVIRVYAHDAQSLDLLLLGHVKMELANGKDVAGDFTARITLVAEDASQTPKIKLYQVWADSAPMKKALQDD
ncbi:hypothetical protein BKA61DRAFT_740901 [Leptodontidium sp. MPI-SDFR-AT-0119]|nr:hypothetical protein BKA61DRAFT_740901 [Leptodontidium sp. MPI-SDFR-AT-0119]